MKKKQLQALLTEHQPDPNHAVTMALEKLLKQTPNPEDEIDPAQLAQCFATKGPRDDKKVENIYKVYTSNYTTLYHCVFATPTLQRAYDAITNRLNLEIKQKLLEELDIFKRGYGPISERIEEALYDLAQYPVTAPTHLKLNLKWLPLLPKDEAFALTFIQGSLLLQDTQIAVLLELQKQNLLTIENLQKFLNVFGISAGQITRSDYIASLRESGQLTQEHIKDLLDPNINETNYIKAALEKILTPYNKPKTAADPSIKKLKETLVSLDNLKGHLYQAAQVLSCFPREKISSVADEVHKKCMSTFAHLFKRYPFAAELLECNLLEPRIIQLFDHPSAARTANTSTSYHIEKLAALKKDLAPECFEAVLATLQKEDTAPLAFCHALSIFTTVNSILDHEGFFRGRLSVEWVNHLSSILGKDNGFATLDQAQLHLDQLETKTIKAILKHQNPQHLIQALSSLKTILFKKDSQGLTKLTNKKTFQSILEALTIQLDPRNLAKIIIFLRAIQPENDTIFNKYLKQIIELPDLKRLKSILDICSKQIKNSELRLDTVLSALQDPTHRSLSAQDFVTTVLKITARENEPAPAKDSDIRLMTIHPGRFQDDTDRASGANAEEGDESDWEFVTNDELTNIPASTASSTAKNQGPSPTFYQQPRDKIPASEPKPTSTPRPGKQGTQ